MNKSLNSQNPLEYRPISLLNSDYKLLTRILENRIKMVLNYLINEAQSGFVPGRHIDAAIDSMIVGMEIINNQDEEYGVLLVDFAKAFDTVEREAIYIILEQLNFPTRIINLIKSIGSDTTTSFNVNGHISKKVNVARGIRQGCPLAPLLFIIVMDFFYRMCRSENEDVGFQIQTEGTSNRLWAVGFADDLSLFFQNQKQLEIYVKHLKCFSKLTGLNLQEQKSLIISPNCQKYKKLHGIPLKREGTIIRFLGIAIKEKLNTTEAWQWYLPKIITRTHMMAQKTTSIKQRIVAFQVIVHAMMRFYAAIHFPPKNVIYQLEQLQKNYIWNNFASTLPKTKARINPLLMHSAKRDGGMGCPDISKVLQKLAMKRIYRWSAQPNNFQGGMIRWLINQQQLKGTELLNIPTKQTPLYIQTGNIQTKKIPPNIFIHGINVWQQIITGSKEQSTLIEEKKIWYNNIKKTENQDHWCFQISQLSITKWLKFKETSTSLLDYHESFFQYANIYNNPKLTDLYGNTIKRKNYKSLGNEINIISDLGKFQTMNSWKFLWFPSEKLTY